MSLRHGAAALTILLTAGCGRCANQQDLPETTPAPVTLVLSGASDTSTICAGLTAIEDGLADNPDIGKVAIKELTGMRITVDLDAAELSTMGVTVQAVHDALIDHLGVEKGILRRKGNEISMTFGACESPPFEIEELISVKVEGPEGVMIPISHIGTVSYASTDGGNAISGGSAARIEVTPAKPTSPEAIESLVQGLIDDAVPASTLVVDPI